MDRKGIRYSIVAIFIIFSLTACTLPGFSTPTPFSFPTPDKTMTALFEPTEEVPATSAATSTEAPQATEVPTDTPEPSATPTEEAAEPTATETPEEPTPTVDATESLAGPVSRSGPSVTAYYINQPPTIDGGLYDWDVPIQRVIDKVVFGADKHSGEADASGTVVVGWNENKLFLGFRVKDDKYVQEATGKNIFKGDSVEILIDAVVSADYYLAELSTDDYQLGITPGKGGFTFLGGANKLAALASTGCDPCPEAYLWYPVGAEGPVDMIDIGVKDTGKGYQVELAIPWRLFNIEPYDGAHYGFVLSISDNDNAGTTKQQSMVSNVSTRNFLDPTSWGDLYLEPK